MLWWGCGRTDMGRLNLGLPTECPLKITRTNFEPPWFLGKFINQFHCTKFPYVREARGTQCRESFVLATRSKYGVCWGQSKQCIRHHRGPEGRSPMHALLSILHYEGACRYCMCHGLFHSAVPMGLRQVSNGSSIYFSIRD